MAIDMAAAFRNSVLSSNALSNSSTADCRVRLYSFDLLEVIIKANRPRPSFDTVER